jgi:lysosomal acid lipase/cholesteryl ester hydrolase
LIKADDSAPFVRYDYGSDDENMKHYGQKKAPAYDLSKVKVPLGIFYGSQDLLADDKDVPWLLD